MVTPRERANFERLIAVNTFVSPWGLEILGSDLCFFVLRSSLMREGQGAINLFKIAAHRALDWTRWGECGDFEKVDCGKHICVTLGPGDPWF